CRPNGRGAIDVATVGGFVDMQWIRPKVGWTISWRGRHDHRGSEWPVGEHRPLDPDLGPDDVPLLKKYCSSPLPPMRRFVGLRGAVIDEIVQSNVGRTSSTTCMVGEVNPGWMPQYTEGEIDES